MRVLITGGAGFIGSHTVRALHQAGHETVVLDALLPAAHGRAASPFRDTEAPGTFLAGDIRDRATMARALHGVDAVCHLAAMVGLGQDFSDAPDYVGCNDHGTAVLLAAMADAGVRGLVLAGSMVVYGEGRYECPAHGRVRPGPRTAADLDRGRFEPRCPRCGDELRPGLVTEDAPIDPRSVYAATKAAQEHLAAAWARAVGGRAVALRYHNVYGPGMPRDTPYAGVASFFRSSLARGEAPRVFEDGRQRRDFVHVRDVAEANALAVGALDRHPEGGLRAYNTGSGEPHTVGEMAGALADTVKGPAPVVTGGYRLGDVRHITASSQRLREELGWRARIGFAEGVAEFARSPLRESGNAGAGPGPDADAGAGPAPGAGAGAGAAAYADALARARAGTGVG